MGALTARVVELLLRAGADPNARRKDVLTLLDLCATYRRHQGRSKESKIEQMVRAAGHNDRANSIARDDESDAGANLPGRKRLLAKRRRPGHPCQPPPAPRADTEDAVSTPSFTQARQAALDALAAGDAQQAFSHVRFQLAHDAEIATDRDRWAEAFDLFARISEPFAGEALTSLVRQTVDNPDDVQALYDLGYELIEQGLPGIAATALSRANLLFPHQEQILTELACALERDQRCHEATRILCDVPDLVENSFFCRYLLAYNSLMTGDLDEPCQLLPLLLQADDADQLFMARRIEGMLVRADTVRNVTALDRSDLSGWHFVVTGGLLLHLSPFGFNDGMWGRYAYTQDSPDRCLEGLQRLAAVLEDWQMRPPRVWRLEDTDSTALAAWQVLGCPVVPWPAAGSQDAGLIVADDLATLADETIATLREHRPGQVRSPCVPP